MSALSAAERSRLVDEREHLLASLVDLDAELAAGDIEPDDHVALRDDYTARAARITRALDGAAIRRTSAASTSGWGRRLAWVAAVAVVAGASAWAMVSFSGARGGADVASGEIRQSTTTLLADAARAFGEGRPDRSIELYGEVLELQPTNVEALTYRGWIQYQMGERAAAQADFDEAVAFDPEYADVRVFRAVAALDAERYGDAADELAAFDQAEPTAVALQLVAERQLRERISVAQMAQLLAATDAVPDLAEAGVDPNSAQLAGETYVQLERPADALRTFDAVLAADPGRADTMAWRGWTLALTAESGVTELFADALDWLDQAVAADANNPHARVFRAFVLRRLERPADAAQDLSAFDALDQQPPELLGLIEQFGLREALSAGS